MPAATFRILNRQFQLTGITCHYIGWLSLFQSTVYLQKMHCFDGRKPFMPAFSVASLLPLADTTIRHELLGYFGISYVCISMYIYICKHQILTDRIFNSHMYVCGYIYIYILIYIFMYIYLHVSTYIYTLAIPSLSIYI